MYWHHIQEIFRSILLVACFFTLVFTWAAIFIELNNQSPNQNNHMHLNAISIKIDFIQESLKRAIFEIDQCKLEKICNKTI